MTPDRWSQLRALTPARIALGRAGTSATTASRLHFQLDHARARDAVDTPFDAVRLCADLESLLPGSVAVTSEVANRDEYRRRPDLGRRLSDAGRKVLSGIPQRREPGIPHLVVVVADGLSPLGVQNHAPELVASFISAIFPESWQLGGCVVVTNGRVAIGDEIGELLEADFVAVIIGERPGLSAHDSVGIYLTKSPRIGCTDASRNCISNVRPGGLDPKVAGQDLARLLDLARTKGMTGTALNTDAVDQDQLELD